MSVRKQENIEYISQLYFRRVKREVTVLLGARIFVRHKKRFRRRQEAGREAPRRVSIKAAEFDENRFEHPRKSISRDASVIVNPLQPFVRGSIQRDVHTENFISTDEARYTEVYSGISDKTIVETSNEKKYFRKETKRYYNACPLN